MTARAGSDDVARLAYCAGIIDGEAYIGASRNAPRGTNISPRFNVRFSLMMADREPVEVVASLVGASVYRRDRKAKAHHSVMYVMDITALRAVELLKQVLPYLRCKKLQAEMACELHDLKQSPLRHKTVIGGKNGTRVLTADHISRCDDLYLRMRRRPVTNNGIEARPL